MYELNSVHLFHMVSQLYLKLIQQALNGHNSKRISTIYCVRTSSVSQDFSFICFYSHLLLYMFYAFRCLQLTRHLLNEYEDNDNLNST